MDKQVSFVPYEAPWIRIIGFKPAKFVCLSNHPGDDLDWDPEDDEEL